MDKAGIEYAGRTLLEHALAAVADATEPVVVGDQVPTSRPVSFTREDPPFGGPAAGLLAGRGRAGPHAGSGWWSSPSTCPGWRPRPWPGSCLAAEGHEGAFLTDRAGRRQLAGVVDVQALERVPPRRTATGCRCTASSGRSTSPSSHPDGDEATDVDTWADVRDLRERTLPAGDPSPKPGVAADGRGSGVWIP